MYILWIVYFYPTQMTNLQFQLVVLSQRTSYQELCIHNLIFAYQTEMGRQDDDNSDGEHGDNDNDGEDNETCLSDRRGSSTVHETRIAGTGGAATSLSHIHTNSFILIHHSLLCVQKKIFYV